MVSSTTAAVQLWQIGRPALFYWGEENGESRSRNNPQDAPPSTLNRHGSEKVGMDCDNRAYQQQRRSECGCAMASHLILWIRTKAGLSRVTEWQHFLKAGRRKARQCHTPPDHLHQDSTVRLHQPNCTNDRVIQTHHNKTLCNKEDPVLLLS